MTVKWPLDLTTTKVKSHFVKGYFWFTLFNLMVIEDNELRKNETIKLKGKKKQ